MDRIKQIKDAAGESEHRERSNATWAPCPRMCKEIFESQTEKEAQSEEEAQVYD